MKTLKDEINILHNITTYVQKQMNEDIEYKESVLEHAGIISYKKVKEFLTKFHESYWEESHEGDKFKRYISCDDLDFLMDKYFGNIVDIKTLQILPNKDKIKNG